VRLPTRLQLLAEQHRIVAKVDDLMALCAGLEGQLAASKTNSSRLLEPILHCALNEGEVEANANWEVPVRA